MELPEHFSLYCNSSRGVQLPQIVALTKTENTALMLPDGFNKSNSRPLGKTTTYQVVKLSTFEISDTIDVHHLHSSYVSRLVHSDNITIDTLDTETFSDGTIQIKLTGSKLYIQIFSHHNAVTLSDARQSIFS